MRGPRVDGSVTPNPGTSDDRCIRLRGVRQNNLKGFDLDLPLGRLIVVTGLSGSGKSSLAFDTLYAEGQRRYIETFSPYARQFFDRMDKPAVDRIENIPPAIAIEQRNSVRTSRSTIGTMTELCDHLKAVWPHVARLHCRQCHRPVQAESPEVVWRAVQTGNEVAAEWLVTFRLPLSDKLPLAEQLGMLQQQGFQRIVWGGQPVRVADVAAQLHGPFLTVVADRVRPSAANRVRFIEACETAYRFGHGRLSLLPVGGDSGTASAVAREFSLGVHCAACDIAYPEPTPALFSFNNPVGACPACRGFGRVIEIDMDLVLPDRSLTLAQRAIKPWQTGTGAESQQDMVKMARRCGVPLDVPFAALSPEHQRWVIEGEPGYGADETHKWPQAWYGVRGYFRWLESNAYKMHYRVLLSRYRSYQTCPECQGRRFNPDSLLYRLEPGMAGLAGELSLAEFYALPVRHAVSVLEALRELHQPKPHEPLGVALDEVGTRLNYLMQVGLGYLTLDRPTRTLSGGETERVNLTTCLGTRLCHTLFVLDEPSVGLHPRDTERLIGVLTRLRDHGNTVVVVEHEASVMRAADQLVDLGPGHGEAGGQVVFQGPAAALAGARNSLTADYLLGRRRIEVPSRRPVVLTGRARTPALVLQGASANNLRNVTVEIPLGRLVCVSGVSGSGKSTLIREVLLPLLQAQLGPAGGPTALDEEVDGESREGAQAAVQAASLTGAEAVGAVVLVDQSSLGRTPRSNPAVYSGAFDDVRAFYAASPEARAAGLEAGAFSFNSAAGQCDRCRGAGFEKIEMQFLSDIFIKCPSCDGRRYREHVLAVRVAAPGGAGYSIGDLLAATVEDVLAFLEAFPASKPAVRAAAKMRLLVEVGLGYLRAGQPINTLSGGEAQRLKLVSHLAASVAAETPTRTPRRSAKNPYSSDAPAHAPRPTLFLFDEPTTGLHFEDVRILLLVFQRLVDAGHSVLVIEHNLDVIRSADWVIDLGPEAGEDGGKVLVAGSPETVAQCKNSHTGRFLREGLVRPE